MKLSDIFNKDKKVLSFEVFPPKQDYQISKLYDTIRDLKTLDPGFVSVTYGAGGSTRGKTVDIASKIKNEIKIESVAHFTCVNNSKDEVSLMLNQLKEKNIQNILALRGDPPQGETNYTARLGGFNYASELVKYIKGYDSEWTIAVAGYPEGHPESKSLDENIDHLKMKVDNGASIIITQLFLDNSCFYHYLDKLIQKGINIPVVPGIFPILSFKAFSRIDELSGAKIPDELFKKIGKVQDSKEDTEKIGIEYAIMQSEDLLKNNVPGLHFYTMNKSKQTKEIVNAVKSFFN